MLALIDYGRGNLASVANALHFLNCPFQIVQTPAALDEATAVILPGVGAWDDAAAALTESGLTMALRRFAASGKPLLGICLGLQLFFESSAEGTKPGLGLFSGQVLHLTQSEGRQPESAARAQVRDAAAPLLDKIKIPHMGWNHLQGCTDPLLPERAEVYFVHSYYVAPEDDRLISAKSEHGLRFAAAIRDGHIRGFQFHPEKSGPVGLAMLEGFLNSLEE